MDYFKLNNSVARILVEKCEKNISCISQLITHPILEIKVYVHFDFPVSRVTPHGLQDR